MQWYEEIMETAQAAVDYVGSVLDAGTFTDEARQVLSDFGAVMDSIADYLSREEGTLVEKCRRYALNAAHSADKTLAAHTLEEARQFFSYEVRPLVLDLRYQLDLEYNILRHPEREEEHLAETLAAFEAARKRPRRTDFKYRVSIIVPAYNKVEFSRCAIESLFRHTDFSRGDIELITINDGSSDETEAYFNSLPHEKKINLKYNVYNHLGWGIARHIAEGEYVVYFSNDAVATEHWLENLLAVHAAEQDVFWVVPTCNEECISNAQGIPVDYANTFEDMEKMQAFAARNNVSNPLLWEERAILMPFVSVVPNLFDVPEIRADYRYTMCDFEDDDFSAMLRRSGFRQILAKDTFVHHFGGVTLNEVRKKQGSYQSIISMRPVFRAKWKVDPWEARGHLNFIDAFMKEMRAQRDVRVLVIEPLFGEGLLQIRNYFHASERNVVIDVIVTDARLLPDVQYMADSVRYVDSLNHMAEELTTHYDMIVFGAALNYLPITHLIPCLQSCYDRLKSNGWIYASLLNFNSFKYSMEAFPNSVPDLVCTGIMPIDGCRIYPVLRLVEDVQRTFSAQAVCVGYASQACLFDGRAAYAEMVEKIVHPEGGDSSALQYLLNGDIVVLQIAKHSGSENKGI